MIRFFRKLRQRLIAENRFTRYLLYAIGEIILVVIGILIALQVNNWNNERKNQEELERMVFNLNKNLTANKAYYQVYSQQFRLRDSLIEIFLDTTSNHEMLQNPQILYALTNSQDGYLASISNFFGDENIELILERKSELPEDYSNFLLYLKMYFTSLKFFEDSFIDSQDALNGIKNYLIENNKYYLEMNNTAFQELASSYKNDPYLKTRLRSYQNKFKSCATSFSDVRAIYAIILGEIENLKGQKEIDQVFQNLGYVRLDNYGCGPLKLSEDMRLDPGGIQSMESFIFYNATNDTLQVNAVLPGFKAKLPKDLVPGTFEPFKIQVGFGYEILVAEKCIFKTLTKEDGYVIINEQMLSDKQ